MASTEDLIRNYLNAVKDPASLKDQDAIDDATAKLEDTTDPIERLRRQEELRELEAPTIETAEEAFVTHAKAWADEAGISGEAFMAEGVPTSVLRRAGFSVGRGGRRGGRRGASRARGAVKQSSGSRVTTEEVLAALPTGSFTVNQVQEATGASVQVVRKAINRAVAAGEATKVGPDPDHSGPGRAATLYRK